MHFHWKLEANKESFHCSCPAPAWILPATKVCPCRIRKNDFPVDKWRKAFIAKSSYLSIFMSYDPSVFHNHWKMPVNNIHWSNVLRNIAHLNPCCHRKNQQAATNKKAF